MKLRWSNLATKDLASILRYIHSDNPSAAERVASTISQALESLPAMPQQGRSGQVSGTREIIVHPWPYFAVYRISHDEVQIIRIRHAKQNWP